MPQAFAEVVARQPDAVALVHGTTTMTYAALDARASQMAHALRAAGVGVDQAVGVRLGRGLDLLVALLGVLKAGGAYVAVDPAEPPARAAAVLDAAGACVLVTDGTPQPAGLDGRATVAVGDTTTQSTAALGLDVPADALAYVAFTSGSTGVPKGVAVPHRGVLRLVDGASYVALGPGRTLLQMAPVSFDASTFEIWGALLTGARLVVYPERVPVPVELGAELRRTGVTTLWLTASLYNTVVDEAQWALAGVEELLVGGEALSVPHVLRGQAALPATTLINGYGPTENTTFTCCYRLPRPFAAAAGSVPLGQPIAHTDAFVIDRDGRLVAPGQPGELYVGGAGLARGYAGAPRLTAERFVPDAVSSTPGARLYRTGDRVRWRADGTLEFLGREDGQIKLRGFRIELGEVEAALAAVHGVGAAAATVHGHGAERRLVGYVVPHAGAVLEPAAVRAALHAALPAYMVPATVVALDALPRTASGKLDRAALPVPDAPASSTAFVAPRTDAEQVLAKHWADVLRVDRVGVHDNFFELGGDSILSIQIVSRAAAAGLRLKPLDLFRHQTIAELAACAAGAAPPAAPAPAAPLRSAPLTPIQQWFLVPAPADPHHFNQAVMLQVRGGLDWEAVRQAVDRVVTHHDMLRARFRRDGAAWVQEITPAAAAGAAVRIDLAHVPVGERAEAMLGHATAAQASFDLAAGPLCRAVFFDLGADEPARLLLVAHHLVVDGVSWRIVVEDLATLLRATLDGMAAQLPPATTRYLTWAAALPGQAARVAAEEGEFWRAATADIVALPAAGGAAGAVRLTTALSARETEALLRDVPRVLQARLTDVLLGALAAGAARVFGGGPLHVDLEGHGRTEIVPDADLSRTVGWFTAIYPVRLPHVEDGDVLAAVADAAAILKAVPGDGAGYGVLRAFGPEAVRAELAARPSPGVSLNYLGQFDQVLDASALLAPAAEPVGPVHAPGHRAAHALEIVAAVSGGALRLEWLSSGAVDTPRVEALAAAVTEALRGVAEHAAASGAAGDAVTAPGVPARTIAAVRARYPHAEGIYPVTPLQHGMIFHTLLHPDDGVYTEVFTCRLDGPLDVPTLQEAWRVVVRRHQGLRSVFAWEQLPSPVQIALTMLEPTFVVRDWRHDSSGDEAARLHALCDAEEATAFDLANGPLLRVTIVQITDQRAQLVWAFHHALLDGWSLPLVLGEVGEVYAAARTGRPPRLEAPAAWAEYVRWRGAQRVDAAERHWRGLLAGAGDPTPLPLAREPHGGAADARTLDLQLDAADVAALQAAARTERVTVNTALLAAWAMLLGRCAGRDDVVFGLTVSGRPADLPRAERLVGLLINTVPARVRLAGERTVGDWLRELQAAQAVQREHEHLGLVDIVRCAGAAGDTPLFESIVVFENYPVDRMTARIPGALVASAPQSRHRSNFPLVLAAAPGAGLTLRAFYDARRFDEAAIAWLLDRVAALLRDLLHRPAGRVRDVALFDATERTRLLALGTAPEGPPPTAPYATVVEWFAAQAARTPEAPAVSGGGAMLTYGELDRQANRLAHVLRDAGVGPETRVGLCLDRTPTLVVAVLGILKAGGAYVPLDPAWPAERCSYVLADAAVRVLVADAPHRHVAGTAPVETLLLDDPATLAGAAETPVAVDVPATALAYVIYTSGSTGRPKGVCVEHQQVTRLFSATAPWFAFGPADVWTLFHSIAFDFSVWELWGALLYGGRLVVVPYWISRSPEAFHDLLGAEGVTILNQTPSAFKRLMEADERPGAAPLRLREVVFGGEALDLASLRPWVARHGTERPRLVNMYGITETTVHVTYRPVTEGDVARAGGSPIGGPIPDLTLHVLDATLEPAPVGARGELVVGGAGVARGYLGRPRLTAERFVPDPFSREPGRRLYRSGDVGRRAVGDVEYGGRQDTQVKIRGFRIELGEIEAALRSDVAVREAVVVSAPDANGDARLVAYVVPDALRAGPARRLVQWERQGRLEGKSWMELPNGLAVVQLNRNETEFLYGEIFEGPGYLQHGIGLEPGSIVFDVGANIGMFSVYAGLRCPGARIFAFEPIPEVHERLALNAELYGLDVTALACGLSDSDGDATFTYYPQMSIFSGRFGDAEAERTVVEAFLRNQDVGAGEDALVGELLDERLAARQVRCPLTTVSGVMRREGLPRLDLLKVDVEKSELVVLQGVADDDWARIRQVIVEVHDDEGRLAAVRALLERQGFGVLVVQEAALAGTGLYSVYATRHGHVPVAVPPQPSVWASPARLVAHLREHLGRTVPEYMVPGACVLLDALPLTANGKLDVRALPSPGESRRASRPPRTDTEQVLAGVWREVLKAPEVGADDDFFALGGHSLVATRVVSRLREAFGVALPLSLLFAHPVLSDLAAAIDARRGEATDDAPADPALVPVPRTGPLALSASQQRLWLLDQLTPGSPAYNVPAAVELEGPFDADALDRAFAAIVARHEVLRTSFSSVDGSPVQVIQPPAPFRFARVDLGNLPAEACDAEVARRARAEAMTPFDLTRAPLVRGTLLRLSATRHVLLLTLHHIVCDAVSLQLLVREWAAAYTAFAAGSAPALPALPVQFADYAAWERARGRSHERSLAYWRRALAGAPALELPTDRPRPAAQSYLGAWERVRLPLHVLDALRALAQEERASLFQVTLAVFALMLAGRSGQDEVVLGTPSTQRPARELEPLIGFFSNTLVLRLPVDRRASFRALVRAVRDVALHAHAHGDVPFEQVVEAVHPERHLDRHPLFQVIFSLQHAASQAFELPGLVVRPLELRELAMRFDLEVHAAETADGLLTAFYYATDLFDGPTVARMAEAFAALTSAAAAAPDAAVADLNGLPDAERRQLAAWNATARPTTIGPTVHATFDAQAERTPEAPAAEYGELVVTYAELRARANRLAHALVARGVGPDDVVAIAVDRGLDLAVAVLAVMKAGAAYLPLDASYPADRLRYMLADSRARVLVAHDRLATLVGADALDGGPAVIRLDEPRDSAAVEAMPTHDPLTTVGPDHLAYVLYTSGSTGRPKGVAMPHGPLLNLLQWQLDVSGEVARGRTLQYAPLSFDPSYLEMFSAWAAGGTLVLVDEDLRRDFLRLVRVLAVRDVNRIYITPAALHQLAEASETCGVVPRGLREINPAGERLEVTPQIARMCARIPGCTMVNQYGPTEAHVVTAETLSGDVAAWPALPTIGVALPNTRMHVVDAAGHQAPIGVPGELLIAGDCLARGYVGKPRLTAERFVPDPFGPPGTRAYRTGDLARYRADRRLDYLGRTDFQVKLRGYRVEPGEVDAVLKQHPAVLDAATVVHELTPGSKHLVSYVVPRPGTTADAAALRAHVGARLPDYMVPTLVESLPALPLTPSGKVDRKALPAPSGTTDGDAFVAPRGETEAAVAAIWAEALGHERFGVHDDFFALGGHSLLAAQVVSRVRRHFGVELPMRAVFEGPTIAAIAERLEALRWDAGVQPAVGGVAREGGEL